MESTIHHILRNIEDICIMRAIELNGLIMQAMDALEKGNK